MRISEWSSDVCSSDLARVADLDVSVEYAEFPRQVLAAADVVCTLTPSKEPIARGAWFRPGLHLNAVGELGRASCRERVCQYVSIWVVAVPLQKTNQPHTSTPHSTETTYQQ